SAVELFDAQVLLDPFEEQFHLPTTAIEFGNCQRRQGKVVGQKDQTPFLLRIEIANAAQFVGITSTRNWIGQRYDLIAHDARGSVDRRRVKALTIESFASTSDEES